LLISSALILVMLLPLWSSTDKKDKTTDEKGKMEWAPKTTLKET